MHTIVHLDDILVQALSNPHDDLSPDMHLSTQVIVDRQIFLQTVQVESDASEKCWKMHAGCKIPTDTGTFLIAVIKHTQTRGTRLLGSIGIKRSEALASGERKIPLHLKLGKVNLDGPCLELRVTFSVSLAMRAYLVNGINGLENQFGHIDRQTIRARLWQMYNRTIEGTRFDFPELGMMHEMILLLPPSNDARGAFLNVLGNICLRQWEAYHMIDDLNQGVCAYEDAVRDTPTEATNLDELGTALLLRFQQLGSITDINKGVSVIEQAIQLIPDDHPSKPSTLSNLGNALFLRFKQFGHVVDLNKSVLTHKDVVQQTPDGHPDKASRLNHFGTSLLARFEELGTSADLNEAVSKGEEAVQLVVDGDPEKPAMLNDLGGSLLTRFEQLGDISDLNMSLLMRQEAVNLTPDSNPHKPSVLQNLGNSLFKGFERLGDLANLHMSVSMQEDAVRLTPDGHPNKPSMLSNLGLVLLTRFERLGDLTDLNESMSIHEEAIHLAPDGHPGKPSMLNAFGNSLTIRFEQLAELRDLEMSILMYKDAVHLTADNHPHKPARLNNLSASLSRRFEQLGVHADISMSVSKQEDAVCLTPDSHPDKPSMLNNLGHYLMTRFEHLGDLNDLKESLANQKAAVHLTPEGHPDKPWCLNNLGSFLLTCFEQMGNMGDLHESVSVLKDAVHLTPDNHPKKSSILNSLGSSLFRLSQQLGDLSDLNNAVLKVEEAVRLTPDGHSQKPYMLKSLDSCLRTRFAWLGDLTDLNAAVLRGEDAVRLTPDGHLNKPVLLSNVGLSLLTRFERLGEISDLNKCVLITQDAIHITADTHPDKPSMLNSLGNALFRRYQRSGDLVDLNMCVLMHQKAVHLTPDDRPQKPWWLNTLSVSLLERFQQLKDLEDLDHSLFIAKTAVALTPEGHTEKPQRQNNLGSSHLTRFLQLRNLNDFQEMLFQFISAASSTIGPAHVRFQAASLWVRYAQIGKHPSLMDACSTAINLLPELAWLGLSISDRHHQIVEAGSVVREAAAAAISSGQPEKAIEWLEQGRSIIWGQLLNLRTPADALKQKHPILADELVRLSIQLDGSSTRQSNSQPNHAGTQQFLQSLVQKSHENAKKRDELLKKIRALDGFHRFLLPKTISELAPATQDGHVIFLNPTGTRCDAFVLLPGLAGEIMHVSLTNFTLEHGEALMKSLQSLIGYTGRGDRLSGEREGSLSREDEFAHILSELWIRLVKPVLDALLITTPTTEQFQRIWWCPTGPLTFLPIHAAGLYREEDPFGSKLSDFVISSYTPSLTGLIKGRRSQFQQKLQLLAVAQPSAVGQAYLPGTQKEIDRIQHHASGQLPVLRLEENMATVDNVQKGMMSSSWVHFACHGVQVISDPTQSALLLAGEERLTLSNIIKLSLPHANFAFLSACQTATGDKKLQEESVHLAAGMLLAGYRGVIATMWTIMDNDAPQVAGDVYEHIFKTSPLDPTRAAEALHLAVRKLREDSDGKKSFFHWVPFIHVGI
ncbi:TPR-like protein, partial [Mycena epipterygia]